MGIITPSDSTGRTEIPIVFITDNNFVLPTSVAITSLILNKHRETVYKVYIMITDDVSLENRKKLTSYKAENVFIELMVCSTEHISNHLDYQHVSKHCLLKFDIPDLFPQYDKILYLDGDILVKKDLLELYNANLNDYFLAGVSDISIVKDFGYFNKLNLPDYFNAGILLLNAKLLRDEKIRDLLYKERESPNYCYVDQDVWNMVCKDKILWLPFKYNNQISNIKKLGFSFDDFNHYYGENYKSEKLLIKDAHILHLCGPTKPWKYKDCFLSKEWMSYFKKSPFQNSGLSRISIKKAKLKPWIKRRIKNFPVIKQLGRRYRELKSILHENNEILKDIQRQLNRRPL
jgi:lipopolysaccharide biosynthesis glycosyltransferase